MGMEGIEIKQELMRIEREKKLLILQRHTEATRSMSNLLGSCNRGGRSFQYIMTLTGKNECPHLRRLDAYKTTKR